MTDFVFPFLWGLVVLSAFIGWGRVAARLAGAADPDWGLSAGWGMAFVLAGGGVLGLAGLALPWVLMALVLSGAALHGVAAFRRPAFVDGISGLSVALIVLAAIALLTRYMAAVNFQAMSCGDDDIAYFTYVSRLLQTGTLIEPFSLRRLSGYGGQTFLQALVVVAGKEENAYLVDRGIAVIVSFGLVIGFFRQGGETRAVHTMVALILTVIMPLPLLNSSSHVTGLVLFLTLFRTLHLFPLSDKDTATRHLWLIGAVAAGAASLKAHFMVTALATVFFFWLISLLYDRGSLGRYGAFLGHLGLSSLVFLAPWMALLQRSSGTILFPLFQGNHQPGFAETYSGSLEFTALLGVLGDFFISPQGGLFCLPVVLHAFRRGSPAGLALYAGALISVVIIVSTLTFDNLETHHRFIAPFLRAAFISTVIFILSDLRWVTAGDPKAQFVTRTGDKILFVLVVLLLPIPVYRDLNRLADKFDVTALAPEHRAAYARMQSAVPEGGRLLAAVEQPFALDYRRNVIFNVDVPGAVSPDPGMPFFKGPGPLKDYLLGQSIPYIAFRDFSMAGGCLYRREKWEYYATSDHPMWRRQSRYFLDFMDNVEALVGSEKTIYRGNGLLVIDLR
ncbi:MAG: hypothetical protein IH994_04885 [Proteobacteria bacterium]|nr:hypothetical protein [Pseudomonadota bacterium]